MFVVQLLAPDIRHERNVVLQCVRYIVRSGFFGVAGKDSNEISVSVNTNDERASNEDVSRDEGQRSDPQTDDLISQSQDDHSETISDRSAGENVPVNKSPERSGVFQQLFAQQLVCDESEETAS